MISRIVMIALFVSLPLLVVAQEKGEAPAAKKAPEFTLKDTSGKEHKLSSYKSKIVVLEWVNPDCPFVKRHYSNGQMQSLAKTYTKKGVVWLSVNSTYYAFPEKLKKWQQQRETRHPMLLDKDGKVGRAYDAKTTPQIYVIKDGVILYNGAIDDDIYGRKQERVNYAEKALDEILAGKKVSTPTSTPYGCSVKYAKPKKKQVD